MPNYVFYIKLFFTGAIVLGLELVASRIMTPFFGVSLHVWSSILAVTLIALAIGYKFGGLISNRLSSSNLILYFIGSGMISSAWMNVTSYSYPQVLSVLSKWDFVSGSIAACFYILIIPLIIFSSLNSVLVTIVNDPKRNQNKDKDHKSGSVFFISTVGSVVGVFVVTYIILPNYSNFSSYSILSFSSAFFTIFLITLIKTVKIKIRLLIASFSILMLIISGFNGFFGGLGTTFSTIVAGKDGSKWTVISRVPSFYGNHTVVDYNSKDGTYWRALLTGGLINNRVANDGTSYSNFAHVLTQLSFSGKNSPRSALVLGFGLGMVPSMLSKRGIEVDAVELDKKIVDIAREYFSFDDKNINITIEDARTFVQKCNTKYDVVVIDLYRGDGIPSHVVSKEFFQDIKACTNTGGSVTMNAFYGVKDLTTKKALLKTISEVFNAVVTFEAPPRAEAKIGQAYLLARNTGSDWSFSISLNDTPVNKINTLRRIFNNWTAYKSNNIFFKNVNLIHDESNDWVRQANYQETIYRKYLTDFIPWQILLD